MRPIVTTNINEVKEMKENNEFNRSVCFTFFNSYLEQAKLTKDNFGFIPAESTKHSLKLE